MSQKKVKSNLLVQITEQQLQQKLSAESVRKTNKQLKENQFLFKKMKTVIKQYRQKIKDLNIEGKKKERIFSGQGPDI